MGKKRQSHLHYWNNERFNTHYIQYRDSKEAGKDIPIPDHCAKSIMDLCENMSHRPNFRQYLYRDEMVMNAIENCIRYFDNFDPDKGPSFSYFSRVAWNSFLRTIQAEKKQYGIKLHSVNEFNRLMPVQSLANRKLTPAEKEYQNYINSYLEKQDKANNG